MKEVTISGLTFEISTPYEAGQTLGEVEAAVLNQARVNAVRANLYQQIKNLLEQNGGDVEKTQAEAQEIVSAYDQNYQLSINTVGRGRRPADPLEKEARAIARDFIIAKLKEKGISQKKYLELNGEEAIKNKIEELRTHPEIIKLAQKKLAEREKMAESLANL